MFSLDKQTGLLAEARKVVSPHCDERPADCEPQLIVIHGISLPPGEFGGPYIDQLFSNTLDSLAHPYFAEIAGMEVSAHFLIRRDGELVQYVPVDRRAWHAGVSDFEGRGCCNDFSVGIELEGADDIPYEDIQYSVLDRLIVCLRESVPSLATAAVVGHSDIAPGRKTDPGEAFDWNRVSGTLAT